MISNLFTVKRRKLHLLLLKNKLLVNFFSFNMSLLLERWEKDGQKNCVSDIKGTKTDSIIIIILKGLVQQNISCINMQAQIHNFNMFIEEGILNCQVKYFKCFKAIQYLFLTCFDRKLTKKGTKPSICMYLGFYGQFIFSQQFSMFAV